MKLGVYHWELLTWHNKKIEKLNEVIDINGSKVFGENGEKWVYEY